jgi:hypothetical protein
LTRTGADAAVRVRDSAAGRSGAPGDARRGARCGPPARRALCAREPGGSALWGPDGSGRTPPAARGAGPSARQAPEHSCVQRSVQRRGAGALLLPPPAWRSSHACGGAEGEQRRPAAATAGRAGCRVPCRAGLVTQRQFRCQEWPWLRVRSGPALHRRGGLGVSRESACSHPIWACAVMRAPSFRCTAADPVLKTSPYDMLRRFSVRSGVRGVGGRRRSVQGGMRF